MKREDLKAIEGMTDAQIDAVMGLHGKDAEAWKAKEKEKNDTIQKAQEQVKTLTDQIKEFDGVDVEKLKKDAEDWEKKYNEGMAAKDKEFAKTMLFQGYEFTSNGAKKAAMAAFDEKNLNFENGKFLGADDFFKELKEEDPGAFKEEKEPEPNKKTGLQHGGNPAPEMDEVTKRFLEKNPDLKNLI